MKTTMMKVALGALLAVTLVGQAKVAILNTQKALLDTAEIKKAQADLEAKYRPRTDDLKRLDSELVDIQNRLNAGAGKLTPQVEGDLNAQGTRKQREMQRKQEDLQADVERDRQEILLKASQRMQEVVKKLSDEKGYDVVFDVANTVHFKPALEITTEATAAYDKAHPVAK
ncbi:OmpH family outer membrane protein [Bryobacter aggregatus]|uniref:OmpH family outer membrane protein n=1 Tax=Bryobacter aggregatus TaxID=360054 RepID=UPI0004E1CC1F|nr:OmpH family outer membrane protein [Bryobacter aggregatus]